jgi:hypothetical protein
MTMSKTLRNQLQELLRTDSEFQAFFADHFPEVARSFDGLDRVAKENLVLAAIPAQRLQDKLRLAQEYSLALSAPSTYGGLLGAALRLDRSTQWADIVDTRDQAHCILFLLHGQRERAGLPFFVDRVCRHLAPEQGERCRIVRVPFLVDAVGARTGADWALRLHSELAQSLGLRGNRDTRELLGLATARQPFFVLLGRQPLPPLDEAEREGLRELLVEELPKLVRGLSYLRFLLVHDYEKPKESQIDHMREWAEQGARAGDHRVRPLDEAVLPTWEHARKYLQDHTRLPSARIDALKPDYDSLRSKKSARYDDLAALLDRKVNG